MKAAEYVRYVHNPEAGLKKTVETDGWEFCVQYRPYDYIMLMENRGLDKTYDFGKRRAELEGTAWFNISIKRKDNLVTPLKYGVSSLAEYNTRLNYYLNEAAKDIILFYGPDTLKPASYVFENNYNLTPGETMVVGFFLPRKEKQPAKDMRLSFVDRMFGNGIINATYTTKILSDIPTLIY